MRKTTMMSVTISIAAGAEALPKDVCRREKSGHVTTAITAAMRIAVRKGSSTM